MTSTTIDSRFHPSSGRLPSIGIVSTFPPTACGLATFAAALARGFETVGASDIGIVRCDADGSPVPDHRVVGNLINGDHESIADAAAVLNTFDCVVLQHEYGIFGGHDGDDVLRLLDRIDVPVITTLHTIPLHPSPHQMKVLEGVIARSDRSVTMTMAARERLLSQYSVHPHGVTTIPHGATLPPPVAPPSPRNPTVLTWGLLGPGKGIEWVIDALAAVSDVVPPIKYVVAGRTHPKVAARDGEAYRQSLMERARRHGVTDRVIFDETYRSVPELLELVCSSHAVVLPYDSSDQITSGVLVDAVAAGVPVISTAFPHSVELLRSGAGVLVPHKDPSAIADALRMIVTRPNVAAAMRSVSAELAPLHSWPNVAKRYTELALDLTQMSSNAIRQPA
ncbi:MAG: glycosyltransferase [Actinobacteria bacterium]|nr:glycosyltransferase [Actinomycetota bacterium]